MSCQSPRLCKGPSTQFTGIGSLTGMSAHVPLQTALRLKGVCAVSNGTEELAPVGVSQHVSLENRQLQGNIEGW
ncbi:hypothetical protein DPMN_026859 [Dreissena polymorpha]|uniref:Uncharacterized protein n=1 Tax=Dreissena polymorpha TaxID=45954 RepID=A0A9D4LTQ5_DREPO|nr:hypothetical protein DPMN_026859 [Dreissena polymorpha]